MSEVDSSDLSMKRKMVASYLKVISKESFDSEQKRYESLIDTSNRLLTSESIITAALGAVISALSRQTEGPLGQGLLVVALIVMGLVVISLAFCLIAQWRWKHELLGSPGDLSKYVSEELKKFKDEFTIAVDYADSLEKVFETTVNKNNKISKCIKISIFIMVSALVLFLIFLVLTVILYSNG